MTSDQKILNNIRDFVIEIKGNVTTLLKDVRKDCNDLTGTEKVKAESYIDQLGKFYDQIVSFEKQITSFYNNSDSEILK